MLRRLLLSVVGMAVLGIAACTVDPKTTTPSGVTNEEGPQSSIDVGALLYPKVDPPSLTPDSNLAQKMVDPIVIADCRLNVFEKEEVPAQKDGALQFLGTDIKPGEREKLTKDQIVEVKINGEKKEFRWLDRGDFVEKDQLVGILVDQLARDDVSIKKAKLAVAEADHLAAEKTKDEAYNRYETQLKLYGTGGTKAGDRRLPATSLEDLRAAKLLAETKHYEWVSKGQAVKQAEAELRQAETTLKMYEIRSDIPGQITEVYKRQGESVKNLEQVVQIHNQNKVRVEGFMDLQYASRLLDGAEPKKGMKVVVEASVPQAQRKPLIGHQQEVTSVAVGRTKDKTVVVSASLDSTVQVWDPKTGTGVTLHLPRSAGRSVVACTGPNAKANLLVCGSHDGVARLWDLDVKGDIPVREFTDQHQGAVTAVAFSPDGQTCATGGDDRRICLWDTTTGKLRYSIPGAHNGMITSLQFTPQCKLVSAGKDNRLLLWTLGEKAYRLEEHFPGAERSGDVPYLGVSPDGRRVLVDRAKVLQVLSLPEGKYEGGLQHEHASGTANFTSFGLFSPDGKLILTAGGAEGHVQLWRVPTATDRHGYEFRQLLPDNQNRSPVTCAAFAPDNSFVVTGYKNREVLLWDVPKPAELQHVITARISLVGTTVESNGQVRIVADLTNQDKPLRPGTTATLVVDPGE